MYLKDTLGLTSASLPLSSFDHSFCPLYLCPSSLPRSRSCSWCWLRPMTASGACKNSCRRSGSYGRKRPTASTRKWSRCVVPSALPIPTPTSLPWTEVQGSSDGKSGRRNPSLPALCCTCGCEVLLLMRWCIIVLGRQGESWACRWLPVWLLANPISSLGLNFPSMKYYLHQSWKTCSQKAIGLPGNQAGSLANRKYFLSPFCMSGLCTILSTRYVCPLILISFPMRCPHFTDGEIDAQRAVVLCPELHIQSRWGWDSNSGLAPSWPWHSIAS